jgi:cobalt-zinc-cadmium efflux system outer membrane protein
VQAIGHSAAQLASTSAQRVRAGDLAAQDAARTEIEARRAEGDVRLAELDQQRAAAALSQVLGRPATRAAAGRARLARAGGRGHRPDLNALVEARADVRRPGPRGRGPGRAGQRPGPDAQRPHAGRLARPLPRHLDTPARAAPVHAAADPLRLPGRDRARAGRPEPGPHPARAGAPGRPAGAAAPAAKPATTLALAQGYERDILPRARQVAAGAELAYGKGAIPLVDLLDARRTLRATLIDAINARAEHARGLWLLRTQPEQLLATP